VIAKNRNLPLLTNDSTLYNEGRKRGVQVYDLRQVLKATYKEELVSMGNLKEIIKKIEKKDNTRIKNKWNIFKE